MNRWEKDDKLEVHSTPYFDGVQSYDGQVVTVLASPGYDPDFPQAYGVLFRDGILRPVHPRFLRSLPPVLPQGRGDLDVRSNWQAFDTATGLDSSGFRKSPGTAVM